MFWWKGCCNGSERQIRPGLLRVAGRTPHQSGADAVDNVGTDVLSDGTDDRLRYGVFCEDLSGITPLDASYYSLGFIPCSEERYASSLESVSGLNDGSSGRQSIKFASLPREESQARNNRYPHLAEFESRRKLVSREHRRGWIIHYLGTLPFP